MTIEIMELLRLFGGTLTIKSDGSWMLSGEKDEHASGDNIQTLNEFASFVMYGYPVPVIERGELRDFAT
jgi:hypothetical protein